MTQLSRTRASMVGFCLHGLQQATVLIPGHPSLAPHSIHLPSWHPLPGLQAPEDIVIPELSACPWG